MGSVIFHVKPKSSPAAVTAPGVTLASGTVPEPKVIGPKAVKKAVMPEGSIVSGKPQKHVRTALPKASKPLRHPTTKKKHGKAADTKPDVIPRVKVNQFFKPSLITDKLTSEQLGILNTHLIADEPMESIITLLRVTWKVFADYSPNYVRDLVVKYKANVILPKQAQLAAKFGGAGGPAITVSTLASKLEQALNPIKAQEELINMQIARVAKLKMVEDTLPTLLDSQTRNIQLLGGLLDNLTRLHMDIGLIRKAPTKVNLGIEAMPDGQALMETFTISNAQQKATLEVLQLLSGEGVLVPSGAAVNDLSPYAPTTY